MLPVTLIFVLSASLVVALVYLPVMGGVIGRLERWLKARVADIAGLPRLAHLALLPLAALGIAAGAGSAPALFGAVMSRFGGLDGADMLGSVIPTLVLVFALILGLLLAVAVALVAGLVLILSLAAFVVRSRTAARALRRRILGPERPGRVAAGYRRTLFGLVHRPHRRQSARPRRRHRHGLRLRLLDLRLLRPEQQRRGVLRRKRARARHRLCAGPRQSQSDGKGRPGRTRRADRAGPSRREVRLRLRRRRRAQQQHRRRASRPRTRSDRSSSRRSRGRTASATPRSTATW